MPLHLIKLSVGSESVSDLADWQQARLKKLRISKEKPELIHITRHMPRRADEVLAGGSIYWVINGWISCRQRILELRETTWNGEPHCGLVYDSEMIRVVPRRHRPFQGWRYFDAKDTPADLKPVEEALTDEMRQQLAEAGLL